MKRTWMVAAALALAAFGFGQVDPNKVIATVNGEQISGNEYYHRMEFLPGVTMNFGGQTVQSTPGFFAIAQLIGEHLLYQLAKQKGCLPTSQEIDAELQLRLADNPKYLEERADQGFTETDVRNAVKHDLVNFKLQTFGITVTDQEVQSQYKKNPQAYTVPKKVHARVIAVKTDADANAVDTDLKAGKDFSDVAKQRSKDVSKATGGDIGTVPVDYFSNEAQPAIGSTKIGATTPWITVYQRDEEGKPTSTVSGKVKYQIVEIVPPKLLPLDKKLTVSIRRMLMLQESNGKVDLAKEIDDMRSKSKVTIALPQFQQLWEQLNSAG